MCEILVKGEGDLVKNGRRVNAVSSSGQRGPDFTRIWFIISCAVVLFAYGVAVGRYQLFPFEILNFGVASMLQVRDEARTLLGIRPDPYLLPARHEGEGVTLAQEDRMAPGLTLVVGLFEDEQQLRLMEPDGTPVRIWPARVTELLDGVDHPNPERLPRTDWNVLIHGAHILPDGSAVFNFEYAATVKLDRCGDVEWVLPRNTHHSLESAQEGGFWIPGRAYPNVVTGFPRIDGEYAEDLILKVSDAGEVLEEVPVSDLFVRNGLLHLLLLKGPGPVFPPGEILHLNDIEELPDSLTDRFPAFEGGDLVLSFRNLHMLMIVEPGSWRVKWYQMGPWIRQHDPDFQPDGTITVFDNREDSSEEGGHLGGSQMLELDPGSGVTRHLYGGRPGEEMHSNIQGKHQMLPGGNILITQARAGRVFEVTESGEVVWELINRYDEENVAVVTQATRYPPSYFDVSDWTCPSLAARQP